MKKYIASVSWGKDSLAMLLRLLEMSRPLDEVVSYNNGMEFQAVYDTRNRALPLLKAAGVRYTELRPQTDFIYQMFEKTIHEHGGGSHRGYSWYGGPCRWGTSEKLRAIRAYCGDAKQYVGIALDEPHRFEKARHENKVLPLVEFDMAEADCLALCYSYGFDWLEDGGAGPVRLYDILDRVSRWCCRNKNLRELRNIYHYLPDYWANLKELQRRTALPMNGPGKSVFQLEERFQLETTQFMLDGFELAG